MAGGASSISPEEESSQLKRSEMLLKSGDISAARLILETLTDAGSGQAAYSLGMSYDPVFFRSNFIKGMKPEPSKAIFWYTKALELGYKEAEGAMLRLKSNN
jgi:TPR repeat protein